MKIIFNITVVLFSLISFSNTAHAQNKIKWVTWEDALAAQKTEKKKIMVDIYTEWCTWCKKMDKATFQKDKIATYINKNFYAIKFDAETKRDIKFNGQTYKYVRNGRKGYHELAVAITQGHLSYPTVVFLDEELSVIQPIPGFQDEKTFEMIMTYFSDDFYKSTPWASYTRTFKNKSKVHTVSH